MSDALFVLIMNNYIKYMILKQNNENKTNQNIKFIYFK